MALYLTNKDEWYNSKISCREDLKVVDDVYSKFDEVHKELFRNSAFGKLCSINRNIKRSNVLFHVLAMFLIESPTGRKDELWFHIGGKNVRFAISDYTLITGLSAGSEENYWERIPTTKRLTNTYIMVRSAVKQTDLKTAFENADNMDDKYKLGLALIYECILRAKEGTTAIDLNVLDIVDDLELFEIYPWGTRSYPYLINSIKNIAEKKTHTTTNVCYGFCSALQVWAFEMFGEFNGFGDLFKLSTIRSNDGVAILPRMCKWESKKNPKFHEIIEKLDVNWDGVLVPLTPTVDEQNEPYVLAFQERFGEVWATSFDVEAENSRNDEAQPSPPRNDEAQSSPPRNSSPVRSPRDHSLPDHSPSRRSQTHATTSSNDMLISLFDMMREMNQKFDQQTIQISGLRNEVSALDQTVCNAMAMIEELREELRERAPFSHDDNMYRASPLHTPNTTLNTVLITTTFPPPPPPPSFDSPTTTPSPTTILLPPTTTAFPTTTLSFPPPTTSSPPTTILLPPTTGSVRNMLARVKDIDYVYRREGKGKGKKRKEVESANILQTGEKRDRKPSVHASSPYTSMLPDPIKNLRLARVFVDGDIPNECLEIDAGKEKLMFDWLSYADGNDFVIRQGFKCNKRWFGVFSKPKAYLSDEHVDLVLVLMRMRMTKYPLSFGRQNDRCIMDSTFQMLVTTQYSHYLSRAVMELNEGSLVMLDCAMGKWGRHESVEWFAKAWTECSHVYFPICDYWIVGDLDVKDARIIIYDSDRSAMTAQRLKTELVPFVEMIPRIADLTRLKLGKKLTCVRDTTTPKQLLSGDYGMLVLKYIEYLTLDKSPAEVDVNRVKKWREKFTIDTFCDNFDP